jgi:hypothetical protein
MPPIPFADNFLAGSIISLLFPIGLLIAIAVWYLLGIRRFDGSPRAPEPGPEAASRPDADAGRSSP